jgi:hypothetical protein
VSRSILSLSLCSCATCSLLGRAAPCSDAWIRAFFADGRKRWKRRKSSSPARTAISTCRYAANLLLNTKRDLNICFLVHALQETQLDCPNCKNTLPYCISTGRHMVCNTFILLALICLLLAGFRLLIV